MQGLTWGISWRSDAASERARSAAVVRCEESDFPREMSDPKTDFFMIDCGHFEFRDPERTGGRKLDPLPFPGAVYVTATGENDSGISLREWRGKKMLLKKLINSRLLTKRLRAEYGLYDVAKGPAQTEASRAL